MTHPTTPYSLGSYHVGGSAGYDVSESVGLCELRDVSQGAVGEKTPWENKNKFTYPLSTWIPIFQYTLPSLPSYFYRPVSSIKFFPAVTYPIIIYPNKSQNFSPIPNL